MMRLCSGEHKVVRQTQINSQQTQHRWWWWTWPLNFVVWQPAVLDNLLTSMKFVLHGMGVLRINLANSRNKVVCLHASTPLYSYFLCSNSSTYVWSWFSCTAPSSPPGSSILAPLLQLLHLAASTHTHTKKHTCGSTLIAWVRAQSWMIGGWFDYDLNFIVIVIGAHTPSTHSAHPAGRWWSTCFLY